MVQIVTSPDLKNLSFKLICCFLLNFYYLLGGRFYELLFMTGPHCKNVNFLVTKWLEAALL